MDNSVDSAWTRIEAAYDKAGILDRLPPGALPDDISDLARALQVTFPDALVESLLRHNGAEEWPTGELLSLARINDEITVWRGLLEGGDFDEMSDHDASEGSGEIKPGWWVRGWIPLDADGAGNGAVVDTEPGPAGVIGQVIDMDHEVGPSGPTFADVADYLADVANDIESGTWVWDEGWQRS